MKKFLANISYKIFDGLSMCEASGDNDTLRVTTKYFIEVDEVAVIGTIIPEVKEKIIVDQYIESAKELIQRENFLGRFKRAKRAFFFLMRKKENIYLLEE